MPRGLSYQSDLMLCPSRQREVEMAQKPREFVEIPTDHHRRWIQPDGASVTGRLREVDAHA